MSDFINTIDEMGESEFAKAFFARTLTEFKDDVLVAIGPSRFRGFPELSYVELPNCVAISSYAFYGCTKLSSISLPWASSYRNSYSDYAFYNTGVSNLDFLPSRVSYLGTGWFGYCGNLTRAEGTQFTSIGYNVFAGCHSLKVVNFPNLSSCGNYVFNNCDALEEVSLPALGAIVQYMFQSCSSLKKIHLSPNISTISGYAFSGCRDLHTVYIGSTSCSLANSSVFYSTKITFATGSIYVPSSRVDYYRGSTNWNWFSTQIKGYDYENDRPVD